MEQAERRVGGDYIGRAIIIACQRVLAGGDIAAIDTSEAERFQMPDQSPVAWRRSWAGILNSLCAKVCGT